MSLIDKGEKDCSKTTWVYPMITTIQIKFGPNHLKKTWVYPMITSMQREFGPDHLKALRVYPMITKMTHQENIGTPNDNHNAKNPFSKGKPQVPDKVMVPADTGNSPIMRHG